MMMIRMAMKATTPPTMPIMRVSSLFNVDCPVTGGLDLDFSVVGIDQMISGSVIFCFKRAPCVKIEVEG